MKYSVFLLLFVCLACGCSRKHPEVPAERNELVLRFVESLKNKNIRSAVEQGEKIYYLDTQNFFLRKLIEIQQANFYLAEAQKALDRNDAEKALQTLDEGLKKYPSNRVLTRHADIVRKIRHAGAYLAAMRNAPNAAAMNSALIAARAGLSGVESPELKKYFAAYEKKIEQLKNNSSSKVQSSADESIQIRSFDDK